MKLFFSILTGILVLVTVWNLFMISQAALRVRRLGATRVGMGPGSPALIGINIFILIYVIVALFRDDGRYPAWGIALWILICVGSLAGWLFGTWIHAEGLSVGGLRLDWATMKSCRVVSSAGWLGATLNVMPTFARGAVEVRLTTRQADRARALLARHGHGEGLPTD